VQAVNGYFLWGLGGAIEGLAERAEITATWGTVMPALYNAQNYLRMFKEADVLMLPLSKEVAADLEAEISRLIEQHPDLKELLGNVGYAITNQVAHLRSVLSAELSNLPIFALAPQRAYDMKIILWNAHHALAETAIQALPAGAQLDLRMAGQCLAFEVATAAGFHVLRALESVARRYSTLVTGHDPGVNSTLGALLNGLRTEYEARRAAGTLGNSQLGLVINMLDRIRSIYRNPIMHPQMFLNADQAVTVFNAAIDAISAMADDARLNQHILWHL
jgi:hypothetical protein